MTLEKWILRTIHAKNYNMFVPAKAMWKILMILFLDTVYTKIYVLHQNWQNIKISLNSFIILQQQNIALGLEFIDGQNKAATIQANVSYSLRR